MGISKDQLHLYKVPGQDVVLPCNGFSSVSRTCDRVGWFFYRSGFYYFTEVEFGRVSVSSFRAARLSVDPYCSLVIKNITVMDVGLYDCRQGLQYMFLNVLTSESHFLQKQLTRCSFSISFYGCIVFQLVSSHLYVYCFLLSLSDPTRH